MALNVVTAIHLLATVLASFVLAYVATKVSISRLRRMGSTVPDYHKLDGRSVPRPGGPAIVAGLVSPLIFALVLDWNTKILAFLLVVMVAFIVGLVDDIWTLGGIGKPALMLAASVPLILLPGVISPFPVFPLFGPVRLTIVYPILVLGAISVTANTLNSIDVLNGAVSGFTLITLVPLILAFALMQDATALLLAASTFGAVLAFYIFHRYPSRIFPGDSGTLSLGAAYGALAIIGRAEFVGIVALLPAILNSFFFLASVKKLVEHRKVTARPVSLSHDGLIVPSRARQAPITLVRLILADGPLSEIEIVRGIFILASFSSGLAGLTAVLVWLS